MILGTLVEMHRTTKSQTHNIKSVKIMKLFKDIYYFLLCHLFPNKINNGALGDNFALGFLKEGDRWYADIKHWPGLKWQLEMVAGADDLLDYLLQFSKHQDRVKISVNPKSSATGVLTKEEERSNGATYRDSLTGRKVWLCNVSKWAFGKHPDTIRYAMMDEKELPHKQQSTRARS